MRLLILLLTFAPTLALAEGGERVIACRSVTACGADGQCAAQDIETVFRIVPVQVDAEGAGDFLIKYGSVSAPTTLQAEDMRLSWSEGPDDAQTLLFTGYDDDDRVQMVWHSRSDTDDIPGQTRFLNCAEPE